MINSEQHNIAILNSIETVCKKRSVKLTNQRRTVLDIMLSANRAMSAYDLLDLLKISEPQAKPPTIYRALDFLLAQGFIHKVESSNSYIVCPHFSQPNHISILFICDICKKIFEKTAVEIENELNLLAKDNHFNIKHSVLEIHGICASCSSIAKHD